MRPSNDDVYIRMAELIAERGTCARRQVGCVLVDARGRVLSMGYNGVAAGRPHCREGCLCAGARLPSGQGLDKCEAIHAEQNAILMLPSPWEVEAAYVTVSPCLSCVKLLLGTSCRRLVCRELYPHTEAIDWWKSSGRQMILLRQGEGSVTI